MVGDKCTSEILTGIQAGGDLGRRDLGRRRGHGRDLDGRSSNRIDKLNDIEWNEIDGISGGIDEILNEINEILTTN